MEELTFKFGAMGSSKSAEALILRHKYEEKGRKPLLIKPSIDNRDGAGIVKSRVGIEHDAIIIDDSIDILELVKEGNYDIVIADEVQFFSKKIILQLRKVVDILNIKVTCYGLRSDFQSNLFEGSYWLFVYADKVEVIDTICHCGKPAIINMRLDNGKPVYTGKQVKLGADESYVAVCTEHWLKGECK